MVATIRALRSGAPQDASLSRRILTGIFWLVLVYTLLRVAAYPIMKPGRDFAVESSANWLNLLSPIFMTLLPVVGTTAFLLMCSDKLRRQLETAAATDYLTGLPNRRTLARSGREHFRRAQEQATGFAVAILDIDNFKAINDTYGHEVGDRVLVHIAECLKAGTHGANMVARTGGEEFAVLLAKPGHEAVAVVERMRLAVQQAHFSTGSATIAVTLSAGVAAHRPGDRTFEDLLRRADQALYAAKAGGRNRVEIARLALVAAPGIQGPDTAEDDKAPHLRSRIPTGLAN
jgi:diguanylate cyclase (GGDEF)-like protein